jgi:hypothetical protein
MSNLTGLEERHLPTANLCKIGARQTVLQKSSHPYLQNQDCAPDMIMKVLTFGSHFNHSVVKYANSFLFDGNMQGNKETGTHMFIDPSQHERVIWRFDLVSNES